MRLHKVVPKKKYSYVPNLEISEFIKEIEIKTRISERKLKQNQTCYFHTLIS